jgi:hypothetical protein
MGKNKDGRRSNRKNSKKNTFNKYGKYTNRSLRILDSQSKKENTKVTRSITSKKLKFIFPMHKYSVMYGVKHSK